MACKYRVSTDPALNLRLFNWVLNGIDGFPETDTFLLQAYNTTGTMYIFIRRNSNPTPICRGTYSPGTAYQNQTITVPAYLGSGITATVTCGPDLAPNWQQAGTVYLEPDPVLCGLVGSSSSSSSSAIPVASSSSPSSSDVVSSSSSSDEHVRYGIELKREVSRYADTSKGDAWRMRVTVTRANNVDPNIFVYRRRIIPGNPEPLDTFECISSPADLEEYPVGAPDEESGGNFFRMAYVDLVSRSRDLLDETWDLILQDRNALILSLISIADLEVSDVDAYGTFE